MPQPALLLRTSTRIPRPINSPLNMSRNAVFARVELASNQAILAEGAADLLANLSDGTLGVELLADGAGGGDDRRVLPEMLVMECIETFGVRKLKSTYPLWDGVCVLLRAELVGCGGGFVGHCE